MELLRRPLLSDDKYQYSVLKNNENNSQPLSSNCQVKMVEEDNFECVRKKIHKGLCARCFTNFLRFFGRSEELKRRTVWVGKSYSINCYPQNKINNQKYSVITFVPGVLYNQFKFFLNLYFLILACSQFVPSLKIGYLYTYWFPLAFVLTITLLREGYDELKCHNRDKEINQSKYKKIKKDGSIELVSSSEIKVGDVIIVEKNERVPADLVLLQTSEKNGTCFIRTDQMDGETDWKLRVAVSCTQQMQDNIDLINSNSKVFAEKPHNDIHQFIGTFIKKNNDSKSNVRFTEESLNIENTIWCNTVVASGSIIGVTIYTGTHTKTSMNTSIPSTKTGLLDDEINTLTKILFVAVVMLSFILVAVKGFDGPWYRYMFRFIILFSYIIPISLRVNLDMGKAVFTYMIQRDKKIPGTLVRTSTLAEELGRINYLLCDKTGTLTQNVMAFKRLHMGNIAYSTDSMIEVKESLKQAFILSKKGSSLVNSDYKNKRYTQTLKSVKAIAICHNVTPVLDDLVDLLEDDFDRVTISTDDGVSKFESSSPNDQILLNKMSYQASSPDEIALVKWTEQVGLCLTKRTIDYMTLTNCYDDELNYKILQVFPFTSDSKRMGIIVESIETGKITFYVKGADSVMQSIVQYNDWLNEECDNMARDGLRTLVVAQKELTRSQYEDFELRYNKAKCEMTSRQSKVKVEVESLEHNMELLCLTGVEDKLQTHVKPTLEMLSNAGIKIWMLTGDKLETSICIAKSAKLVQRDQEIHIFADVSDRHSAHLELNAFRRKRAAHIDAALIIKGSSLTQVLQYYANEFVELACQASAVIICRCSPTQKAHIVRLLRSCTKLPGGMQRVCAIGDGGNDVSMIQAAHCGIGIEGKEGRQASLASDFSISQFSHIQRLLMCHGRDSYKRSAALSQFIIHRGLIISVIQAIFSSVFYFSSVSLYQGFLMIGYTTIYTMLPVFSLVLDQDVKSDVALRFPELYRDLKKGRSLSFKTFLLWILISIYQGGAIMYGALLLFDRDFTHIVSISFTSLIITQLLMVALTIRTWHWLMYISEALSILVFVMSIFFLQDYFDMDFLMSSQFLWKTFVITAISCLPLAVLKYARKRFSPPIYTKLDE